MFTDAPIFDADQHMYESPEARTRYLPERYRHAVQFVQVGRVTRLAIDNRITDFIPNPTLYTPASRRCLTTSGATPPTAGATGQSSQPAIRKQTIYET